MSSKRRFSRQAAKAKPGASSAKSRIELRRELAEERFAKPGSDRLWTALLGWDAARVERIWLIQSLNDAARRGDASSALRQLEARAASLAARLERAEIEKCLELWRASGDEYVAEQPAPKWHYLAALSTRLGLGEPSAEQLQDDWEAWTSLRIAAPLRNALMTSLAQSEQAATALHGMTQSENVAAIADLIRLAWSALAYAEPKSFEKLRERR